MQSTRSANLPASRPAVQLMVIVILILVFIAVAAQRIWQLRIVAEQTAVTRMIGTLRSAVGAQVMERILHGGPAAVADMEHADPMQYLDPKPANFESTTNPVPPEQMIPYRWYYDTADGILTYRVGNEAYLDTPLAGPARIRLQLQLHYQDRNGNGRYDPDLDGLGSINLVVLDPFQWREPGK